MSNNGTMLIGWFFKKNERCVGPLNAIEVTCLVRVGTLRPADKLVEVVETMTASGPGTTYAYREAASVINDTAVSGEARSA
jgi:hypothetical protein